MVSMSTSLYNSITKLVETLDSSELRQLNSYIVSKLKAERANASRQFRSGDRVRVKVMKYGHTRYFTGTTTKVNRLSMKVREDNTGVLWTCSPNLVTKI